MPNNEAQVNESAPRLRRKRAGLKRPERRLGERDRRLLEATMKYRGEFMNVELFDLSETGAYIVAPCVPAFAESVTLTVELVHLGATVMITGRVRRVGLSSRVLERSGGFAIQFTRFYSDWGRNNLRQHLAA